MKRTIIINYRARQNSNFFREMEKEKYTKIIKRFGAFDELIRKTERQEETTLSYNFFN